MSLAKLEQLELAQRKALMRLIKAEFTQQSTPTSREEMKVCREGLRAMRVELRKLRKA